MVLEKIVSISDAIRKPAWMFVIGGLVSVVCTFVAFFSLSLFCWLVFSFFDNNSDDTFYGKFDEL
jgi:hypothetical protein